LTIKETSEILGKGRMTLHRWEQNNNLQPIRVGGTPKYKLSDINKILKG
jgi:DNA-binding transcriptional MerR regulator